jgi:hypothetical protein
MEDSERKDFSHDLLNPN